MSRNRRPDRRDPAGYWDLRRDLEGPGCPACRGANRFARKYIDALLWEMVNDGHVRARLRAAHGFCREHTLLAIVAAREQSAQLGMALLYEDFLRHIRAEAVAVGRAKRGGARRTRRRPGPNVLAAHAVCPACESADRVVENYLAVLATAEPASEIGVAARSEGRLLCVPHFTMGAGIIGDPEGLERLTEIFLRGADELRTDLLEHARKHDYRYADEPPGREADAWVRGPEWVVGRWTGR